MEARLQKNVIKTVAVKAWEILKRDDDYNCSKDDDGTKVTILGEIIGATNLVAAKREKDDDLSRTQQKNDIINSYCVVYWDDEIIHQTKVIPRNNNPIWSCETGCLFLISINERQLRNNACLRIEVFDKVSKKKQISIGEVMLEGTKIISDEWCNEKRQTLTLIKDKSENTKEEGRKWFIQERITQSVGTILTAGLTLFDNGSDALPEDDLIDDDNSLYGRNPLSFDIDNQTEIDDNFVFGKNGTLALRFREASNNDINFMKAIELFDQGYKHAKKSQQQKLAGVKLNLNGKLLAQLITEKNTSICSLCTPDQFNQFVDYAFNYRFFDDTGVQRRRVKPGPNPLAEKETQYLTEAEMITYAKRPSTQWIEAGSGDLGRVYVEVISCEGLKTKHVDKMIGKKCDPFVCLIYEDCLVETDYIRNCSSPLFMPWSQRAFIFNTMNALSSLYVGVFDYDHGPIQHKGLGRVTIDLNELKSGTNYTLKYDLYSSPVTSGRKSKGKITIRVKIERYSEKKSLLSIVSPPLVHVNVKRRKTLAVARFTCYGKYREDVYNLKILRSYIDELLEYLELLSDEVSYACDSLLFWRGQVTIWNVRLPLYSATAYLSAIYVTEHPQLFLSYLFFCCAWILLIISSKRSNYPAPMYQSKSFFYYVRSVFPFFRQETRVGVNIDAYEGHLEEQSMIRRKKKRMKENQRLKNQIAHVRGEMQKIVAALTDLSIHTSEVGANINPLSKLLPVQLLLRDLMYYIRFTKSLVTCENSGISFILIVSFIAIGSILILIPCGKILHWLLRLFVWFVLGPWIRLTEFASTRHKSSEQMRRIVEEIKEKEQNRLLEARINKEESIKLRATRCLRFGRFVIRVPYTNTIRYHDKPLPESFAESSRCIENGRRQSVRSFMHVTHYVPGQKHHGVMIPELKEVNRKKPMLSDARKVLNHRIKRNNNTWNGNDLVYCPTSEEQSIIFVPIQSIGQDEEGFELIPIIENEIIESRQQDEDIIICHDGILSEPEVRYDTKNDTFPIPSHIDFKN